MSAWQDGELAVCIDASKCLRVDTGTLTAAEKLAAMNFLVEGRSYTIEQVVRHWSGCDAVFLAGQPLSEHPYCAKRFALIRPDEQEACEPEFVTLLKRAKRTVTA